MTDAAPGDPREFAVSFPTARGTATLRLAVPARDLGLADLVPLARQMTQILADAAIEAEAEAGRPASCRAGCGACCRQLVLLSIPEALDVARVPASAAQRERMLAVRTRLGEAGLLDEVFAPRMDPGGGLSPTTAAYFRLGMPCPYLEDEACGIYARRPVPCRDYSVTTPAAWCADVYSGIAGRAVRKIPMPPALTGALARLAAELTGEPPRLVPLSLAPLWAEENPGYAARTWPGEQLLTAFLHKLGP